MNPEHSLKNLILTALWTRQAANATLLPGVAGVTLWDRPNIRASVSLSIFAISPIDQRLTPCKVIMIALD
ncbi:hypothetical protein N7527_011252 [Penicillium freii]|uniref:Uncharacterized protein n=1 Tax=Penicillium freii TaxID=48697 RepID=A0A101MPQ3_PENFR|nr:hypothetical protein N7527_011252 [Penicillium freii]KUM64440.1 hypothetical protein ACN42_g2659 [Penicillium freii]